MIRIAGLEKRFKTRSGETVNALTNVNLDIRENEFISVVGPSGCGKTTLLRILAGLESRSSGTIQCDGAEISGPRPDVGVVFQQATLLPWNTVLTNVLLPAHLRNDKSEATVKRAEGLLAFMGLKDFAQKYPFELSGGMQQRVAICRALMREPRILLMDEPFGALDAMTREAMNMELMRVWSEERKTVIFITHSIPEAVLLSDRVVVMSPRPGRISEIIDVDVGRPRSLQTMATPRFGELCDRIRTIFGAQSVTATSL
ncbi:ABC transporter ATP-binding protein [Bradyrhizobium cenepequi]|uniref:ABC transporter ATP-binding protein n=1 Tax=Bradyrhizobium cenepequi TaxID=2821403 RepID=UPI001CE25316|nr:ABC transporter ATP-binding protein [Bradyrhizobium cenepequi]MCA6106735.1 ABC transporter ATP-binding protein [Bradyrhizobium cenepequi]